MQDSDSVAPAKPRAAIGSSADTEVYQINFKPNWICREVVEVLVIAPAVPEVLVPVVEDVKVIKFGVLKFARFSRLKISARNWSDSRSPKVVVLKAEKSHVARPGPISVSRPKLP